MSSSIDSFGSSLLVAVDQALSSGEISLRDARRIRWACNTSRRRERFLESARDEVAEGLLASGAVASMEAIDWSAIIQKIIENLPAIIELIKLFF